MSTVTLPQAYDPTANGDALYEVVGGVRVEIVPMGAYAGLLAGELFAALLAFVKQHRLGRAAVETLFILDAEADLRRRPDIAYVSADRWPLDRPVPTGDWSVVPDLAVEVTSPNDIHYNVLAKVREYLDRGVRQVWVVEPAERKIYVYDAPTQVRIVAETDDLATDVIPGFMLKVSELFQTGQ